MDVLSPPLININGRIYRKNIVKEDHEEEDDFSYMGPPGKFSSISINVLNAQMYETTAVKISKTKN